MEMKNARRLVGMWMLFGLAACGPAEQEEAGVEAPPPAAESRQEEAPAPAAASACADGQTFVTNQALDAAGFGAVADAAGTGTCLDAADWELMQQDASRLLGVELISAEEQALAAPEGGVRAQAAEYYLKSITATETNTRIDAFRCKNYSYTYNQGCSVSLSGSVSQNISLNVTAAYPVASATLGYSVTWGTTKTYSSSTTIKPRSCIEYRLYSNYKVNGFALYEDDIWYDDYIGTFKTRKYNYTWIGQYGCSL
jgi:hypothetical protein